MGLNESKLAQTEIASVEVENMMNGGDPREPLTSGSRTPLKMSRRAADAPLDPREPMAVDSQLTRTPVTRRVLPYNLADCREPMAGRTPVRPRRQQFPLEEEAAVGSSAVVPLQQWLFDRRRQMAAAPVVPMATATSSVDPREPAASRTPVPKQQPVSFCSEDPREPDQPRTPLASRRPAHTSPPNTFLESQPSPFSMQVSPEQARANARPAKRRARKSKLRPRKLQLVAEPVSEIESAAATESVAAPESSDASPEPVSEVESTAATVCAAVPESNNDASPKSQQETTVAPARRPLSAAKPSSGSSLRMVATRVLQQLANSPVKPAAAKAMKRVNSGVQVFSRAGSRVSSCPPSPMMGSRVTMQTVPSPQFV